jgi:GNAT superfamily N-acetyltransferase
LLPIGDDSRGYWGMTDVAPLIRPARHDDLPAVVALLVGGSLVDGKDDASDLAPYRAALAEIDATPGSEVLVVEEDGDVVGVCQLIAFRHLQARGGRCAEIESMHVRADRRAAGIGGALLEAAVERAWAAGCYRVQLTSNVARVDAHRFYERHGFEATHRGFKRLR